MAGFVSVSFSFFVPQTKPKLKEMEPRKLDKLTLSKRAIATAAASILVLPSGCVSRKTVSLNWRNYRHLWVTSRPLWEKVSFCSRNMVIAGYWVGPDVDDGWGFVEAFIHQIT